MRLATDKTFGPGGKPGTESFNRGVLDSESGVVVFFWMIGVARQDSPQLIRALANSLGLLMSASIVLGSQPAFVDSLFQTTNR